MKPHGVGYITITKITFIHIDSDHQKLDLISSSLS
jgi:hypothetical protein